MLVLYFSLVAPALIVPYVLHCCILCSWRINDDDDDDDLFIFYVYVSTLGKILILKKQDCFSIEGGPPANTTHRHAVMLRP